MVFKHSVKFLQRRILGDIQELRDRLKLPVLVYCDGRIPMVQGSPHLVDWLKTKTGEREFQSALDQDVVELTNDDDAGPTGRPTVGEFNRANASPTPKKLDLPLNVLRYRELWDWLSK